MIAETIPTFRNVRAACHTPMIIMGVLAIGILVWLFPLLPEHFGALRSRLMLISVALALCFPVFSAGITTRNTITHLRATPVFITQIQEKGGNKQEMLGAAAAFASYLVGLVWFSCVAVCVAAVDRHAFALLVAIRVAFLTYMVLFGGVPWLAIGYLNGGRWNALSKVVIVTMTGIVFSAAVVNILLTQDFTGGVIAGLFEPVWFSLIAVVAGMALVSSKIADWALSRSGNHPRPDTRHQDGRFSL